MPYTKINFPKSPPLEYSKYAFTSSPVNGVIFHHPVASSHVRANRNDRNSGRCNSARTNVWWSLGPFSIGVEEAVMESFARFSLTQAYPNQKDKKDMKDKKNKKLFKPIFAGAYPRCEHS